MKLIFTVFLLISSISPLHVKAQKSQFKFKSLTVSDGLSSNNTWNVVQDNKGFIWIGTHDGLNLYDGYSFKIYKHKATDSTSLSHSFVSTLFFDSKNRLWAGTPYGVNLYDAQKDSFIRLRPVNNGQKSPAINWIYEDANNRIWMGTSSGLNYYDEESKKLKNFVFREEIKNAGAITAFIQDQKRNYWLGTEYGLFQLLSDGELHSYKMENKSGSLSNNLITSLFEDKKGNIWIGTESGLNLKKEHDNVLYLFKNTPESPDIWNYNAIRSIAEDNYGNIWVGTKEGGLNKYNEANNSFTKFIRDSKNKYSIIDNSIKDILIDKTGGMWVATYRGISFFDYYQNQFNHLEHKEYDANSLTDNYVTSLYKDSKDRIWSGNRDGISLYDPLREKFTHYLHDPENPNTLGDGAILSIAEDKNGDFWTSTHLGIISKLNHHDNSAHRFEPTSDRRGPKPRSNFVLSTKDGNIWIAHVDGISFYDIKSQTFSHYDAPAALGNGQISYLHEDKFGNLLVVGWGGIILFDRKKNEYVKNSLFPEHLYPFNVNHVYEDSSGTLFIGTAYNGIISLNLNTGFYKEYKIDDHLPEIYVKGILEDANGNLWISSTKGLYRFDPASQKYKLFDKYDGLINSEFNSRACITSKDGKMYFGGNNGITVFDPEKILENPNPPNVAFTKFELFNKEVPVGEHSPLKSSISEAKNIDLTYLQNVFSFEFVGLNFNATEKNQYAYKMIGFDQDWNYSGTRRYATYTNLPPGKTYTFQVKASNNDGVWNDEGTSVNIYISPPFWATWWFKSMLIVVLLVVLYLFYRWRTRQHYIQRRKLEFLVKERTEEVEAQKEALYEHANRLQKANDEIKTKNKKIKRQANKLKVIDHLKSEFLANISHEFRTPLTLIIVPLEEMIEKTSFTKDVKIQLSIMNRNAQRLLQLINQLLDLSKLENGSIPLKLSQKEIISYLKTSTHSFLPLAHKNRINYTFTSSVEEFQVAFDEDKFEKIIYNLLSNAFKFTESGGEISVQVDLLASIEQNLSSNQEEFIQIIVADTGKGIPAEHLPHVFDRFYQAEQSLSRKIEGAGIGLALTKELVELHGGSIKVESDPGKGTRFIVLLPVIQIDKNVPLKTETEILFVEENNENDVEHFDHPDHINEIENVPLLLIVEDNKDLRQQIIRIFGKNFRIEEAEDGIEGWEKACEKIPDLIISDVMMPGKDGFALCHQLKNDVRTSHIPTILLSARIDGVEEGLKIGADDFIAKPFNAKTLELKVKNLLDTRQKFREAIRRELGNQNDSDTTPLPENSINIQDQQFIQQANDIALKYINDVDFEMETLYRELGMSRTLVYKKIKSLTGLGPNEFIRHIRLNKASQLLLKEKLPVNEVMFRVGFNHRSYFIKCFKSQFGHLPSEHSAKVEVIDE